MEEDKSSFQETSLSSLDATTTRVNPIQAEAALAVPPQITARHRHPETNPQLFPIPEVTFPEYFASDIVEKLQPPLVCKDEHSCKWVSVIYESVRKKFHHARVGFLCDADLAMERLRNRPRRSAASQPFHFSPFIVIGLLFYVGPALVTAQIHPVSTASPLPDAPLPVIKHQNSKSGPCRVIPRSESAGIALSETGASFIAGEAGLSAVEVEADTPVSESGTTVAPQELPPCPPQPLINFYQRFMNGPEVKPLTPKEKGWLAIRNVVDPFNAVTILGNAGITIGANSHTVYGPGMHGFAQLVGVSYTEDMTGEFIGTFLIPSVMHMDPHYHRMPHATIKRRIFHGITQVVWTQGDNGKGMLNYSALVGYPICLEIANLYVPGEKTNLPSTANRYATGLAIAPTDNFITEFLPDLARRIHVRVVLVQQIINQVAHTEPEGAP